MKMINICIYNPTYFGSYCTLLFNVPKKVVHLQNYKRSSRFASPKYQVPTTKIFCTIRWHMHCLANKQTNREECVVKPNKLSYFTIEKVYSFLFKKLKVYLLKHNQVHNLVLPLCTFNNIAYRACPISNNIPNLYKSLQVEYDIDRESQFTKVNGIQIRQQISTHSLQNFYESLTSTTLLSPFTQVHNSPSLPSPTQKNI